MWRANNGVIVANYSACTIIKTPSFTLSHWQTNGVHSLSSFLSHGIWVPCPRIAGRPIASLPRITDRRIRIIDDERKPVKRWFNTIARQPGNVSCGAGQTVHPARSKFMQWTWVNGHPDMEAASDERDVLAPDSARWRHGRTGSMRDGCVRWIVNAGRPLMTYVRARPFLCANNK